MRYVFKASGLLLFATLLRAQTGEGLNTYGGMTYDKMYAIDFMGASNIALLGLATTSFSLSGDEDFALITPNWQRVIGNPGVHEMILRAKWTNSGDIVVGGIRCNSGGGPGSCSGPQYGFITVVDSSGYFSWGRSADFSNNWGTCVGSSLRATAILDVSPTSDGGFLAAGYLTYNQFISGYGCVPHDADGFIAKFNSSGGLSWIRIIDDAWTSNIATTAFESSDGNYVLLAPSVDEVGVFKFNTSGSLVWQRRYPRNISGTTLTVSWGRPTSDGGFILATQISGSLNDALFIKFNSSGNFVCARRISTSGEDYGIDVAESNDYYWMTGSLGISGRDLFIAKIRKTDCAVLEVRRILSSAEEEGLGIDINPSTQIPYVAGYTSNSSWSNGGYDGLVAADSGGSDTCYWRNYTATTSLVSLTSSGSYTIFSPSMSVSSITFNVQTVSLTRRITCGLDPLGDDSELGSQENFVSCEITYALIGNNLRIKVKSAEEIRVEIYDPSGKMVFNKTAKEEVINVPLRRGVYFLKVGRKVERIVIH